MAALTVIHKHSFWSQGACRLEIGQFINQDNKLMAPGSSWVDTCVQRVPIWERMVVLKAKHGPGCGVMAQDLSLPSFSAVYLCTFFWIEGPGLSSDF